MEKLYDTKAAAEYLGIKPVTVRYYVSIAKTLVPDYRLSRGMQFTQATLDAFKKTKAKPRGGRKPKPTNVPDVAARFGVDQSSVTAWCRQGLFPHARKQGRYWFIPSGDLKDFVPPGRR